MPNEKFDAKSFNPQAFKYRADRIPRTRLNEMRKSRVLTGNPDIRAVFTTQDGTAYARLAMRGLLDGDAVNYDGQTDITATSTKTFEQGVVVVGRAKAWVEKDFSYDITGGQDFMDNVAKQVADYWQDIDQDTLLAILRGVFAMTSTKGAEFVKKHTYEVDGPMEATTLNSATAQACGDHKKKFSMIFMHSVVSTNLENLNLLTALKYTDKEGVTRDLTLYTWNGKLVIVDDGMPTEQAEDGSTVYTSYVLGEGTINYEDIGAKVPYEMARDPKTNGGQDTLYTRQRKVFAPFGLSYEKAKQASLSPTDDELADGTNWDLVHSGEATEAERSYVNDKVIAIARIKSKG
ncbi:phage coat protein [Acutalibacter caecimuris]|uniref:phage coat protein n=1 Tax=Acutalibacter caecimuris TaxID=3093657 RepID=UPI002AC95179|nr:phage coat protein [Acutalibacter sp. M00118]